MGHQICPGMHAVMKSSENSSKCSNLSSWFGFDEFD